jgi:hypothetical protein
VSWRTPRWTGGRHLADRCPGGARGFDGWRSPVPLQLLLVGVDVPECQQPADIEAGTLTVIRGRTVETREDVHGEEGAPARAAGCRRRGRPAAAADAGCPAVGRHGLDEVRSAFAQADIDHVIMGAGLDLEARLEIVREIFLASDKTTVHLKDFASGPDGFLPFVRSVLAGLADYQF